MKDESPALKLGFKNFPMDQFGVQKPALKANARTPEIPQLVAPATPREAAFQRPNFVWQAQVRNIAGLGDRSAYGLPDESGVLILNVPGGSTAAAAGLQKDDVIVACRGQAVRTVRSLQELNDQAAGQPLKVSVIRKQQTMTLDVIGAAFVVSESQDSPDFQKIPLAAAAQVLPAKATVGAPGTVNERPAVLTDGKLAKNYGPVFSNGVVDGLYKLDLGSEKSIAQVNTFSHNQNGNRGRQKFILYGSRAKNDPGWTVDEVHKFTQLIEVDTREKPATAFVATSARRADGRPLGTYRWLIWAISPVTSNAGGENTAFQEFQVLPAGR